MKAAIQTAPQPRLRGSVGKQSPQTIPQQPKVGLENQQPKVQQPLLADQQLTHEAKGHEEVQAAGEQERMQRAPNRMQNQITKLETSTAHARW